MKTPPDRFAVDMLYRLLELPPAERSVTFNVRGGRKIRLERSPEVELTLTFDGPWNEDEKTRISSLLVEEVNSRPDLHKLRTAEDPLRGLVFLGENPYSASAVVHRIADEVLGVNPARLPVTKSYDDHDARPEIARYLYKEGSVEVLHEESGVRVWARLWGREDYSLEVPVACLDPRRGQRDRAKSFIANAGYSAYDADLGPVPAIDDNDETWAYSRNQGGSKEGANQALRLICKIVELPLNIRVKVGPVPEGG